MRNKLIIFLFLIYSISFGQSVPNTTTFTFFDVSDAVYGDHNAGRNLSDAFTNSNAAYFNPAYGSKTMDPKTMLGFRNYHVVSGSVPNYITQGSMSTTDVISSIEISNSGQYVYLMFPSLHELRIYTLTTSYDVSTISSTYQSLNLSSLVPYNGDTKTEMGLWLSPDDKEIYFTYSHYSCQISLTVGNDLGSMGSFVSNDLASLNVVVFDIALDPTNYHLTGSSDGQGGGLSTQTFHMTGGLPVNENYSSRSTRYVTGFEFNSTGSKYYTMDIFNTAKLLAYTVGSTAYSPTGITNTPTVEFDISSIVSNPNDFCFSNSLMYMYVVKTTTSPYPKIYQFSLPAL